MNTVAARKYDDTSPLPTETRLRLVTRAGNAANDETYEHCTTQLPPLPIPLPQAGEGANGALCAAQTLDDVKDQLINVSLNAANLGVFSYDYQGHRIVKDMGGSTVRYAYDGNAVLVETDTSGTTLAKFDYGPDRLLSMNHATEGRAYYLFDALGSVSNLTNTAGGIQARYQYDAWGNYRSQAGSSFNRFAYTGHEKDNETNLYYFKARYYDPDTGRFINQDAYLGDINTPPSLHRYLYAYANPTVYIDLTGYESLDANDEAGFTSARTPAVVVPSTLLCGVPPFCVATPPVVVPGSDGGALASGMQKAITNAWERAKETWNRISGNKSESPAAPTGKLGVRKLGVRPYILHASLEEL